MKVLCVGGPKNGEYVDVIDPYRGLFVPVAGRSSWFADDNEDTSPTIRTEYYRMEKFSVTGGFIAPVFVLASMNHDEFTRALIPLIFSHEFLETRV